MSCQLRQATAADQALVQQLAAQDDGHVMTEAAIARVLSGGDVLFLAEVDDQAAGYIHTQLIMDEVTVLNLFVSPGSRRQGIAGQLLNAAQKRARQDGAARCLLEVRAGNQGALALYQSLGYTEDGRRNGYYPGVTEREDAVLMSAVLAAGIAETNV
ncbi:MAG: ribosomal protein S18-alanine N-acetyltransferase [Halieaceae bacterium]